MSCSAELSMKKNHNLRARSSLADSTIIVCHSVTYAWHTSRLLTYTFFISLFPYKIWQQRFKYKYRHINMHLVQQFNNKRIYMYWLHGSRINIENASFFLLTFFSGLFFHLIISCFFLKHSRLINIDQNYEWFWGYSVLKMKHQETSLYWNK